MFGIKSKKRIKELEKQLKEVTQANEEREKLIIGLKDQIEILKAKLSKKKK